MRNKSLVSVFPGFQQRANAEPTLHTVLWIWKPSFDPLGVVDQGLPREPQDTPNLDLLGLLHLQIWCFGWILLFIASVFGSCGCSRAQWQRDRMQFVQTNVHIDTYKKEDT